MALHIQVFIHVIVSESLKCTKFYRLISSLSTQQFVCLLDFNVKRGNLLPDIVNMDTFQAILPCNCLVQECGELWESAIRITECYESIDVSISSKAIG